MNLTSACIGLSEGVCLLSNTSRLRSFLSKVSKVSLNTGQEGERSHYNLSRTFLANQTKPRGCARLLSVVYLSNGLAPQFVDESSLSSRIYLVLIVRCAQRFSIHSCN